MNVKKFNEMLEERIKKTRAILDSKNKEYASDIDKLHNFKRAGAMENCSPEKALIGMWAKHIISILDMMDELNTKCGTRANSFPSLNPNEYIDTIEEKIGDAINYLILLEALIKERKRNVFGEEK